MTGNLLAGIILGPACLDAFAGFDVTRALQPFSTFAMGLITVSVGSHLSYRRIHNALQRILTLTAAEVLTCALAVTLVSRILGLPWSVAFVLGTISVATAPGTTVAIIREMRAKGSFVKTLVSVVALDNILCVILFAFSSTILKDVLADTTEGVLARALVHTGWQFAGSLILGLAVGRVTERLIHYPRAHNFSVVFTAILFNVGISEWFDLSPLLTCLFYGVYLGNASEEAARMAQALEPIELLLFSLFFTMAGVSLHLDSIAHAGALFLGYLFARAIGKSLGACFGGLAARSSRRIWMNTAMALVPEAGVTIGLVVLISGDPDLPEDIRVGISAIVLASVAINEIAGPLLTRRALRRSKEDNKDRRRLIEFLQEEFIVTDFEAEDKWAALEKLTSFFLRTHHVKPGVHDQLFQSIKDREEEFTTAVGRGAAIPHGRIHEGVGIRGVLALCRKGIEWNAPDGQPVQIVMLVVTPKGYEKEHLEVMASLAQMISEPAIRTRLLAAVDPNDAWEIIESEDTRNYNYFLEETENDKAVS